MRVREDDPRGGVCRGCGGAQRRETDSGYIVSCSDCGGTGRLSVWRDEPDRPPVIIGLDLASGEAVEESDPCGRCGGSGYLATWEVPGVGVFHGTPGLRCPDCGGIPHSLRNVKIGRVIGHDEP